MLDGALASMRSTWTSLLALVLAIRGELRAMDGELLLGESQSGLIRREIGKEELEQPGIAEFRGRRRRSIEPGSEG